ncbi:MAG: hypothetical protein ACT6RN_22375 [Agrobacterium sp.]|uniref:hypothetical protein n=1 Tax=Agrobacterium sp. TaxID=361 RepID=UPI004038086D
MPAIKRRLRSEIQDDDRMNDNVVKFRKPVPPKKPREPLGPKAKKALTIVAVIVFFAAVWGYFTLFGQG